MSDDLKKILGVATAKSPWGPEGPNEMEVIAISSYEPDFKHVVVNMRGVDGNAMVIVGTVRSALSRAGATPKELAIFVGEALSGDYENVLATVVKWVTVVDEPVKRNDAWSAMVDCVNRKETND